MKNTINNTFSKEDTLFIKGIAILFMLFHHLFCFPDDLHMYEALFYDGIERIKDYAWYCQMCVGIYVFLSGYGMFCSHKNNKYFFVKKIKDMYISFWKVFIIFVPITIIIGCAGIEPVKLAVSFFTMSSTYNPTWWFLRLYIYLSLISPVFFCVIDKIKKYYDIPLVLAIIIIFNYVYVNNILAGLPWGISKIFRYFPFFAIGSMFAKYNVLNNIKNILSKVNNRYLLFGIFVILFLISFRMKMSSYNMVVIMSVEVAVISFVVLKMVLPCTDKFFLFFGKHSTNMFLIHTFFYLVWYPDFFFAPRYVVPIFLLLVIVSLAASIALDAIYDNLKKCKIYIIRKIKKESL